MYHFENGYHAEVKCECGECSIEVTGNGTHVRLVHLSIGQMADNLVAIQHTSPPPQRSDLEQLRETLKKNFENLLDKDAE